LLDHQGTDTRPSLLLWAYFVCELSDQAAVLLSELKDKMRSRADEVEAVYPDDAEVWRASASHWNGIFVSNPTPTKMSLVARNGVDIRLEFSLTSTEIQITSLSLPPDVSAMPPFIRMPRTSSDAHRLAKEKAEIIVSMLRRHLDPVAQIARTIQKRVAVGMRPGA